MEEVKETQIVTCFDCRKKFNAEEIRTYEDQVLCESCWDLNMGFCESCSESFRNDDLRAIKDQWYCGACIEKKFVACHSCDEYVAVDRAIYSEIHEADYCPDCAGDYLVYCVGCDGEVNGDSCYRDDSGDPYCESCWDNHEQTRDEDDYIQQHELSGSSFEHCRSRRKFGVEIEACLDSEEADHLPQNQVGLWSSQHDGSLGNSGREYASPILQGDEGFQEIEQLTSKLKSWGYFIQKSCGLHVHIDGRDLGCEDIRKLLKIVLTYESVIYAMLPEARFTGSYSVPLTKFPKSRFRTKVANENDLKAVWYGRDQNRVNLKSKYHHSRYYGVNIHSWFFRRSVEFRYHSGTINPVKIKNFINICQALVDKAHAVKFAKVRKFEKFQEQYENFISFLGLPSDLALYIKQRILKFHPDRFGLTPVLTQ